MAVNHPSSSLTAPFVPCYYTDTQLVDLKPQFIQILPHKWTLKDKVECLNFDNWELKIKLKTGLCIYQIAHWHFSEAKRLMRQIKYVRLMWNLLIPQSIKMDNDKIYWVAFHKVKIWTFGVHWIYQMKLSWIISGITWNLWCRKCNAMSSHETSEKHFPVRCWKLLKKLKK